MTIKQIMATKNACYKAGTKHTVKGIVVHSTGANNPNLCRYVQPVGYAPTDALLGVNKNKNDWCNNDKPDGREVCVHAFVGKLTDGTVATYQILPWDIKGWHSGSGSLGGAKNANNNGYIGFEICEDGLTDKAYFDAVYKEAVELCAYLCKQYGIKPESPTLICHSEGNKLGIASGHADVMHWFPKHGKSMDTFRADVADVKAKLGGVSAPTAPAAPAKPSASTVGEYKVKITTETLHYRAGAGTNYGINGSVKKGEVYRIVAEADGAGAKKWGKLYSGAGWIALDYTVKV